MKTMRIMTIAAIMAGCVMAQTTAAQDVASREVGAQLGSYDRVLSFHEGLACVVRDSMQGYINKKGEEVIPLVFDRYVRFNEGPHGFSCGRAVVKKNGKYGYVDREGHRITDYIYDIADAFNGGFARVSRDGKWTWIDINGTEILPCVFDGEKYSRFDGAGALDFGLSGIWMLVKKDGKLGVRKVADGEEVIPCEYDEIYQFDGHKAWLCKNSKWGLWINGRVVLPCEYESPKKHHEYFRDHGFNRPLMSIYKDDMQGLIDSTGTFILPCDFDYTGMFSEGLAEVRNKDKKYGYADTTGTVVIPFAYDQACSFSQGLAMVVKGEKYGYIDKTGQVVIPINRPYEFTLEHIEYPFVYNGIALTRNKKGYGLIDKTGRQILPCVYSELYYQDNDSGTVKLIVTKGEKVTLLNGDGQPISTLINTQDRGPFLSYADSILILAKGNKYVLYDINGKELLQVDGYDFMDDFQNGLARVTDENGMVGYIDKTGRQVIPCEYDNANHIYCVDDHECTDLIEVEKDKKIGIYNKEGKMIFPCILDKIFASQGLIWISSNDKHGLMAVDGTILLYPQYDYDFINFHEGLACVVRDKKYGYIDLSYQEVIPCQFDESGMFSDGLAWFRQGNRWGYIDHNGNIVLSFPPKK